VSTRSRLSVLGKPPFPAAIDRVFLIRFFLFVAFIKIESLALPIFLKTPEIPRLSVYSRLATGFPPRGDESEPRFQVVSICIVKPVAHDLMFTSYGFIESLLISYVALAPALKRVALCPFFASLGNPVQQKPHVTARALTPTRYLYSSLPHNFGNSNM
jgi:hypothetical protein